MFLYELYTRLSPFEIYYWMVSKWIAIKMQILSSIRAKEEITIYFYNHFLERWSTYKAFQFLQWKPIRFSVYRVNKFSDWICSTAFVLEMLFVFLGGIVIAALIFTYKGNKKHQRSVERGGVLISSKQLARLLKNKGEASKLIMDGLPLVKDTETTHTLLVGTTGVGKTNCLYKLLPQIRESGQKAIIVDLNGNFVSRYFRKNHDFLLNPFDTRCTPWSPWADCKEESHYDAFAKAIMPGLNSHDTFWDNAGATVLSATLRKLKDENNLQNSELCNLLLTSQTSVLEDFLAGTEAAAIISEAGEKMTISVRATLNTQIKALKYIEDTDKPFSIRDWIATNDDSWLFITASPDQRETLSPLICAWIDIALNGLMSLKEDSERRVWFILDELPALPRIPSLKTGLAEARKYGGCVVAGIQNLPQLQTIYGYAESQAMMNLFNTLFIFRTQEPETCRYLSNLLGEQEIREEQEGLSYSANEYRDGVNIQSVRRKELLVISTEISNLPNLECFIKLAGNYPITKLKMTYQNPPRVNSDMEKKKTKPEVNPPKRPPTTTSRKPRKLKNKKPVKNRPKRGV